MKPRNSISPFSGMITDKAMNQLGLTPSFDQNRVNSTKPEQFVDRSLNLESSLDFGGWCLEFHPAAIRHDPPLKGMVFSALRLCLLAPSR